MKKQKINNLSLNKKTISNFELTKVRGGAFPTLFPCWSKHSCPTRKCTEGPRCGDLPL